MSHQPAETPPSLAPEDLLDDVLTDVSKHLRNLASWMPLVREIADTHREGIDFIPRETRQRLGRQHADRNSGGQVVFGTDARGIRSPAPGNLTSWALEADVEMTLRHLLRFVVRHQPDLAGKVPTQETTEELIGRIRGTFMRIGDLRVATAVAVDLEMLAETCKRVLFGEDRTELPSPCPHCGRRTLVVYLQTGVIRCERPRDQGRIPECRCPDQLCQCHVERRFEHHWLRDRPRSHAHSWPALQDALTHPKETPCQS